MVGFTLMKKSSSIHRVRPPNSITKPQPTSGMTGMRFSRR